MRTIPSGGGSSGESAWTDATALLENSWTEAVSVDYYKDGEGVVHLRGMVTQTTGQGASIDILSLPAGYRPAQTTYVPGTVLDVSAAGAYVLTLFEVGTDGDVSCSFAHDDNDVVILDFSFPTLGA